MRVQLHWCDWRKRCPVCDPMQPVAGFELVDPLDISPLGRELFIPHKVRSWRKPLAVPVPDDRKVAHGWHPSVFDTRYRPDQGIGIPEPSKCPDTQGEDKPYRMFPDVQEMADTYGRAAGHTPRCTPRHEDGCLCWACGPRRPMQ